VRILAVDDDDIHLRLLSVFLRKLQYEDLTLADSSEAALNLILDADPPFECFILDINMPGMNGIELCRTIRSDPKYADVSVLMLTGLSDRKHMEAAFQAGATDYITKPIEEFELSVRLKLANELLVKKREIDTLGARIKATQNDPRADERVSLSTAFALDDVLGAIEYLAFENFLFRTSVEAHNLDVVAVKVANVEDIFKASNSQDFQFVMNCVGDTIGDALKTRQFFLSYAGNGIFPIALLDNVGLDLENFVLELFNQSSDLDLILNDRNVVHPELVIGAIVKSSFLSWKANLNVLSEAIANVESAASQLREATPRVTGERPRKWSPRNWLLKVS